MLGGLGFFFKLRIGKTFERHPNGDLQIILTLVEQCQVALGLITAITWQRGSHLAHPHSACYVQLCLPTRAVWDLSPMESDRAWARRSWGCIAGEGRAAAVGSNQKTGITGM